MDTWYKCKKCGHIDTWSEGPEQTCEKCGSPKIEGCEAPPVGRPVPLRVLHSAEARALYWKKQAEQLSALLNRAATDGVLPKNYVTEARVIQAGMI